jgi:hypothetical protein
MSWSMTFRITTLSSISPSMITPSGTSDFCSGYFSFVGTLIYGTFSFLSGRLSLWELSCDSKSKAPYTSSNYGASTGHFDYFLANSYGSPTFGGATRLL